MGERYFTLKKQLEQLGYNNHLPPDGVPLVECLTADLLQTTRSLRHYMEATQDTIRERNELVNQAEPYKYDNARLIAENICLNKQIMHLKEEQTRILKDTARKMKSMNEEIKNKEISISKLKQQCREFGLRGVYAETLSFRSKMKNFENRPKGKNCDCATRYELATSSKVDELTKKIKELEDCCEVYRDEVLLLEKKVAHRDEEINRLQLLFQGGRPLSAVIRDCGEVDIGHKVTTMYKEHKELELENVKLAKELEQSVEKQHEAMLRALSLAEKNQILEEELSKLDKLALKVEDECNSQIKSKSNENIYLREQVAELLAQNNKLKVDISMRRSDSIDKLEHSVTEIQKVKEYLKSALKEKDEFFQRVKALESLNNSLQEKLSSALSEIKEMRCQTEPDIVSKLATKEDLKDIVNREKYEYERKAIHLQRKMADALEDFNKNVNNMQHCHNSTSHTEMINELYCKISTAGQRIHELEKENDVLRTRMENPQRLTRLEEQLIDLKAENAHLRKGNIVLAKSLDNCNQGTSAEEHNIEQSRSMISMLHKEIELLISKNNLMKNENKEIMTKYNNALDIIEKLKMEMAMKSSQIEQLEEENSTHRMTNRSERGSVEHLRDECNYLREKIMTMQDAYIKEKMLTTQLKSNEAEMEGHIHQLESEILSNKKKITIINENYVSAENKCKDLHAEVLSLRIEKSKLYEDMKRIDNEHENMLQDINKKTESLVILEQSLKSKDYSIENLEKEIDDLKQKNNVYTLSERKLQENEHRIQFLNTEIQRLKDHNENAMIEKKHLQMSLANVNAELRSARIEQEKSQKDADGLRLQLQHYVAEVKRIEDLLSHKEAERADMLENFASLSVEANMLENTNHSLENEAASKSLQLETYKNKIEELQDRLAAKENTADVQNSRITNFNCKVTSLENEIRLIREEKIVLENNNAYLKDLCQKLEADKKLMDRGIQNTGSELQMYENKITRLSEAKSQLEIEHGQMKKNISTLENLLSATRREVIELKLALKDATCETKLLKEQIDKLNSLLARYEDVSTSIANPISSAIEIEETIQALSQEEKDLEEQLRTSLDIQEHSRSYSHGNTL